MKIFTRTKGLNLYQDGQQLTREYKYIIFGFMFLKEKHYKICKCNYCKPLSTYGYHTFGFTSPVTKKHNGWRKLFYVAKDSNHYIRFTIGRNPYKLTN